MSYEERQLMYKQAVKYRAEYKDNKLSIYNGLSDLKVELDDVHMTEKQIDDLLYLMWRRTLSESSCNTLTNAEKAYRGGAPLPTMDK